MKKLTLVFAAFCFSIVACGQEIQQELRPFTRVVASPRINIVLNKGKTPSVRLVYHGVSEDKINMDVRGKTLRIYLDQARKVERTISREDHAPKEGMYEGASVTAYVTYRELDLLEIRGAQELTCIDPIESEKFVLRAYGENDITLASLKTPFFKAKLYGENDLLIRKGKTLEQKFLLYGENRIDTQDFRSDYIITRIFGEGSLKINSSEEVLIHAFGEPQIVVDGGAQINKRLIIGKAEIIEN